MIDRSAPARLDVILVGEGARAASWGALLSASPRARIVGVVGGTLEGPDAREGAAFASLDAARDAHPRARVAVAAGPRAALSLARSLDAWGAEGLVAPTIHAGLAGATFVHDPRAIQVAHGWVTAAGRVAVEKALAAWPNARLSIEARGVPEAEEADALDALWHALALGLRLAPGAHLSRVVHWDDRRIELALGMPGRASVALVVRPDGHGLEVRVEDGGRGVSWSVDARRSRLESRVIGAAPSVVERALVPADVRALGQLVDPGRADGDHLGHAQAVAALVAEARPSSITRGARAFREAARVAAARPDDPLAWLGLAGALPAVRARAGRLVVPTPDAPLELWAYRAGVKPVAFLTVSPDEADRAASFFPGAHVERRARRVHVGAQDAWVDRRDEGAPRVELYVSEDPALAAEAARLQADTDPSAALVALGALMGYPACCVAAFAAQDDRANNTRNRYATAARTRADGPWPWALSNLHTMLVPFYPCRYDCAAARAWAEACLAAMEAAHPGVTEALEEVLGRPSLYFDHARLVVLDGVVEGGAVRYSAVATPPGAEGLGALGDVLAAGDTLTFDDDALVVEAGGRVLVRLARTDPGLGFVAPFGRG